MPSPRKQKGVEPVKQRPNEATMRADALALLNAVEELMRGGLQHR
jgi:hypothetical protein